MTMIMLMCLFMDQEIRYSSIKNGEEIRLTKHPTITAFSMPIGETVTCLDTTKFVATIGHYLGRYYYMILNDDRFKIANESRVMHGVWTKKESGSIVTLAETGNIIIKFDTEDNSLAPKSQVERLARYHYMIVTASSERIMRLTVTPKTTKPIFELAVLFRDLEAVGESHVETHRISTVKIIKDKVIESTVKESQ